MQAEERTYPVSKEVILNVIWDMMELQKGKRILSVPPNEKIIFSTEMYDIKCRYNFSMADVSEGCKVRLEMDEPNASELIYRAFALFESLMAKRPKGIEEDGRNEQ